MAKVITRIDIKTGNITFEINGIQGSSCKDITELLGQSWNVYEEEDTEEMWDSNDLPDTVENM